MNGTRNKILSAGAALGLFAMPLVAAAQTSGGQGIAGRLWSWAISGVVGVGGIPAVVIGTVVFFINYIMGYIAATLFSLGGWLLEYALQLNSTIMGNPIIEVGWNFTRDIANLGFVFAIIVIAFATILRIESYGMKKALGRLVFAALLVNFSLVIAGVVLDFAGVLTNTLIAGSSPAGGHSSFDNFAQNLAASFGVNKILEVTVTDQQFQTGDYAGAFSTFTSGTLSSIASIFFVAIFTFFGAITFLVISLMVLIRYIILSLLLVVAPLAWLFLIFDDLKHLWSKWWSEFIRWTFFLPGALFFLHLAIFLALNRGQYVEEQLAALDPSSPEFANLALQIASAPAQIGQMLLILGLMYGGITMSYTISGQFGGIAKTAGSWSAGRLQDFGRRKGAQFGSAPFRSEVMRRRMDAWAKGEDIKGRKLTGAGLALRSAISRPIVGIQKLGEEEVGGYKKRLEALSTDQIALRYATALAPEKAAIMDVLAEKSALHKLPTVDMDIYKRYGMNHKNLVKRNPLLDEEVVSAIKNNKPEEYKAALRKSLSERKTEDWKEAQWKEVLGTGIHTAVAGRPEWNDVYNPLTLQTIFESHVIDGREMNPTAKNEIAQIAKGLSPDQRRKLKDDVERMEREGTMKIKKDLKDYLNKNLGRDLFASSEEEGEGKKSKFVPPTEKETATYVT